MNQDGQIYGINKQCPCLYRLYVYIEFNMIIWYILKSFEYLNNLKLYSITLCTFLVRYSISQVKWCQMAASGLQLILVFGERKGSNKTTGKMPPDL